MGEGEPRDPKEMGIEGAVQEQLREVRTPIDSLTGALAESRALVDEKGRVRKEERFDKKGKLVNTTTIEYIDIPSVEGKTISRPVKTERKDANGDTLYRKQEWNRKGQPLTEVVGKNNLDILDKKYEWDEDNLKGWSERLCDEDGKFVHYWEQKREAYPADPFHSIQVRFVERDGRGKLVKEDISSPMSKNEIPFTGTHIPL